MQQEIEEILTQVDVTIAAPDYSPQLNLIHSLLDVTDLSSTSTDNAIVALCKSVADSNLRIDKPAAVCLYPSKIETAKSILSDSGIKIACVAAGFPHGQVSLQTKLCEILGLVQSGIDEIDIVINVPDALEGKFNTLSDEVKAIKAILPNITLKVIIESMLLKSNELIYKVSKTCLAAGADFIKTSTGKEGSVASPEAAIVMCKAIMDHYNNTGKKAGFKAAGGVSDIATASIYIEIVRTVLGEEWLIPECLRIGASRLRKQILSTL